MNNFDFHCHLDDEKFKVTREELLINMKEQEVGACTIGVDLGSSKRAVTIATACENIWAAVGQHPLDNKTEQFKASEYQALIDTHKNQVVCVGECGLDYYWPTKDLLAEKITEAELKKEKTRQEILFRKNIALAIANSLPLMLHVRSSQGSTDAHEDTLRLLEEISIQKTNCKVVFHFYTEGPELSTRITEAGYYISLPGVITFAKLDEVVQAIPLNKMFAETDSPYAAPVPHRGQTNNPMYVEHVYKKIAEIKGIDEEKVRTQILKNVQDFFNIKF